MAEKIVPIEENPSVVKNVTNIRFGIKIEMLNNIPKNGNIKISISNIKDKLASILPKNITSLLTGHSIMPSKVPLSFSRTNVLLIPSTPEKVKAVHKIPGATIATNTGVGSMAKLNINSTSPAKTIIGAIFSLVRNSNNMSFQSNVKIELKYDFIPQIQYVQYKFV